MAKTDLKVDVNEALKTAGGLTVAVRVIGVRRLKFRLWLSTRIFKLGALIIHAPLSIEVGMGPAREAAK